MDACRLGNTSATELTHLLHTSSHSTFKQLLQQLLLPCLHIILAHKQDPKSAETVAKEAALHKLADTAETLHDMRQRGSAWAMLGMLRLHLSAPPPGADPIGKYAYKKAHFDRMLTEDVLPETQVSSMAQQSCCMQCVALPSLMVFAQKCKDGQGSQAMCLQKGSSLLLRYRLDISAHACCFCMLLCHLILQVNGSHVSATTVCVNTLTPACV